VGGATLPQEATVTEPKPDRAISVIRWTGGGRGILLRRHWRNRGHRREFPRSPGHCPPFPPPRRA